MTSAGNRVVELGVRAVTEELAERGAPPEVVSDVRERLLRSTGQPAPISRCVVATERGVLFDELTRSHHAHPVVTWAPLPDLAALSCNNPADRSLSCWRW